MNKMRMTKRERCLATINGEKPDRIPYSMWSHMPQYDHDAEAITQKTIAFYHDYDVDFIKTMNNGMYSIEDFGAVIDYSEVQKGGRALLVDSPIKKGEDWAKLSETSLEKGALHRELLYLQMLLESVKSDDVPVIFTVFSPITTANKLCGGKLAQYLHSGFGQELKKALEAITLTTEHLTAKAIELGADGIFMASQVSNYMTNEEEKISVEEYQEFGKPYDIRVLNAANQAGGWLNALHCHGEDIMFDIVKDYPVQVLNWHVWETLPTIDEALSLTDKCIMGGLKRFDITNCNYNAIRHQIYECCRVSKGKRLFLTPGCVIRYPLNSQMLSYVKKVKEEIEQAIVM